MIARPLVAAPLVLAACVLAACGQDSASPPKDETHKKILTGIEKLRAVPASDTTGRLAASKTLSLIETKSETALKARDACSQAYSRLADASELTNGALAEMKNPAVRSDPKSLAERMHRAEEMTDEAEEQMQQCNTATAKLSAESPD